MTSLPLQHIARTPLSTHIPLHKTTTITTTNRPEHDQCLVSLDKCTTMSELKQIHAQMLRSEHFFNPFNASRIVSFSALHCLDYARLVFSQISNPTPFTFNSIIRGYTNNNRHREALLFYSEILAHYDLVPDRFTFPSLFKSCKDLFEGKPLHCHATKLGFSSDTYVQNTLINMYSNCGCLASAKRVFDRMEERTVVSWATMIGGFAQWGKPHEAFTLFEDMELDKDVAPNEVTLVNVLTACARSRDVAMTKRVHEYVTTEGFVSNEVINTALMDVYCKCGCVSLARDLFDKIHEKSNIFCWNIMINGYVEDGDYEEALLLFREMQIKGVKPDKMTMASLLLACTQLGAPELGKWLHFYIKKHYIEIDVALGTALVDMYAKCGNIECAFNVFHELPEKDVLTWTSLILGLAMSGRGKEALDLFNEMQNEGTKPDAITFVGVLAACSHAGLSNEGVKQFGSMSSRYGIEPTIEHYGGLVDLLGRAGRLNEAEELISTMPMKPDCYVLGGLLGACRKHGNLEMAERVAKRLWQIEPDHCGSYILLLNIYKSMQKWDEDAKLRELMRERGLKKPPGCSMIEIDGVMYEFVKGDKSHNKSSKIYEMLEDVMDRLKKVGYVANKHDVLFDMDEEEKETELSLHSEKLAIAFGLISTRPGTQLRVVKNLRVCNDCHTATKFISKVYSRDIIVRDQSRFHHFKDGSCSCGDFW